MILGRVKISGHSMLPIFKPGDTVLISTLPYLFSKPKIGDIIVFRKSNKLLIKRIVKKMNKEFFVSGDNQSDSFDSKDFGVITRKDIIGKTILKL
jgi:nickel-type superoxide dismutase maturation protease